MTRKQIQELLEASSHITEIIKNDDLMFNDFPPLIRLKNAIETITRAKMLDHYNKVKSSFKVETKSKK